MEYFALPALFALVLKMWVYAHAKKTNHTSQTFLWLVVFFALHNLSEVIVISQFFEDEATRDYLLRFYYVALLFSLSYMCIFVKSVISRDRHNRFNYAVLSGAVFFSLIVFQSDLVIAGSKSIGYTVTAIRGDYYYLFQAVVLLSFAWIFFALIRRYLNTLDIQVQLKCFYAVFALSPIIIMSMLVMAMMQMGFKYTGAMILPFASTFVLLIVVLTQKNNDLINIGERLPFTAKKRAERKLIKIYRSLYNNEVGLNDAKRDIEKILVQSALDRSENNVSAAAKMLGLQRSTLYSIFNRLEMNRQNLDDLS